jgi:hypothetical protein
VTDRESIVLFVHVFMRSGIQSPYLSHPLWLSNLPSSAHILLVGSTNLKKIGKKREKRKGKGKEENPSP